MKSINSGLIAGAIACAAFQLGCEAKPAPTAAASADSSADAGGVAAADAGPTETSAADATADATTDATLGDTAADAPVVDRGADAKADAGADLAADAAADTSADSGAEALVDTGPEATSVDVAVETAGDVVAPIGDCVANMADSSPANAVWTLFAVSKSAGPCPPAQVCKWSWTVALGGAIAKDQAGVQSTVQMGDVDYSKLSQVVSNTLFVSAMATGWKCDTPPTDISVTFELALFGVKHSQDVTGCVVGGMGCNWAKGAYELVAKY